MNKIEKIAYLLFENRVIFLVVILICFVLTQYMIWNDIFFLRFTNIYYGVGLYILMILLWGKNDEQR